ncbi:hypothetical protein [Streptomyces olivoreticuli]|uniref:hypothetical protein n=1 Tax=Streptomyces olivoreticuli TaxID=68246 RepID=UPI0013C2A29F|nr:hypothetical protein [Streptomyces olivoreticuli]
MATHCKESRVQTTVHVQTQAGWTECPTLPTVLGEDQIGSCEDLALILESQGGVVARLLRTAKYSGFRLLARHTPTRVLAGSVEWVRSPESGIWVQWDEPWTACQYGQHKPTKLDAIRRVRGRGLRPAGICDTPRHL